MGIYKDVMSTLVRVLAADNIDNSTKQSWQKLIDAEIQKGGNGSSLSPRDKFDYDCCLYALLHRQLDPAQWDVLVAKYSTHKANKVAAIGRLVDPQDEGCSNGQALHRHDRLAGGVLRHEHLGYGRQTRVNAPSLEDWHCEAS
jgi:hypothetical protein